MKLKEDESPGAKAEIRFYCLPEFKQEYEKLKRKNSYKTLCQKIVSDILGVSSIHLLQRGRSLSGTSIVPFVKAKIGGSGGLRLYYLLLIENNNVYLMFLHPKSGTYGAENINDRSKALLHGKVSAIITGENLNYFKVLASTNGKDLKFIHISKLKPSIEEK